MPDVGRLVRDDQWRVIGWDSADGDRVERTKARSTRAEAEADLATMREVLEPFAAYAIEHRTDERWEPVEMFEED